MNGIIRKYIGNEVNIYEARRDVRKEGDIIKHSIRLYPESVWIYFHYTTTSLHYYHYTTIITLLSLHYYHYTTYYITQHLSLTPLISLIYKHIYIIPTIEPFLAV